MNKKIVIKTIDEKIIFKGNILDIPIKEEYIIKKSIDLFDDDDPCIIHKSYVIKNFVDELLSCIPDKKDIYLKDIINKIDFLNIDNIENCILNIEG